MPNPKSSRLISARQKQVLGAEGFAERASLARESFAERGYPVPSQAWLAARASTFLEDDTISQPTMGKWLTGKAVPESPMRAWALAKTLGVDPGWLVFGEESGAPQPVGVAAHKAHAELGPEEMFEPKRRETPKASKRRKRG